MERGVPGPALAGRSSNVFQAGESGEKERTNLSLRQDFLCVIGLSELCRLPISPTELGVSLFEDLRLVRVRVSGIQVFKVLMELDAPVSVQEVCSCSLHFQLSSHRRNCLCVTSVNRC